MKRVLGLIFIFMAATAAAKSAKVSNQLLAQKVQFTKGDFILKLTFKKPLRQDDLNVAFGNNALELNIPNVGLKKDFGKGLFVGKDKIRLVYTYAPKDGEIRSRIIFTKQVPAKKYENQIAVERSGKQLLIRVKGVAPETKVASTGKRKPASKVSQILPIAAPDVLAVSGDSSGGAPPTDSDLDASLNAAIRQAGNESDKSSDTAIGSPKASKAKQVQANTSVTAAPAQAPDKDLRAVEMKESKIAIPSLQATQGSGAENPLRKMVIAMGIVALMGAGVLFALKKWTKQNVKIKDGAKIKVVTQYHLGPKKSLAIVHVAGESVLIGITEQNISMIKSLALIDDEIPEQIPPRFSTAMRSVDEPKLSIAISKNQVSAKVDDDDEFAASDLREIKGLITNRLKDMRNL